MKILDRAERAIAGARNKPLSKHQRQALSIIARQAWTTLSRNHAVDQDFETWRHQTALKTCGLRISEARNGDFLNLKTAFLNAAGRSGEAYQAVMKQQTEEHAWAFRALMAESAKTGISLEYVRAIARDKFKETDFDRLTPQNLWHLTFSLRRRGQINRAEKRGPGQKSADVLGVVMGRIHAKAGIL